MGQLPVHAPRLLEKQRPRVLCEIHSEHRREFSCFHSVCENGDENHILALPK